MSKQYQHWRLETDNDSIAWLHADKAGESTNSLSQDMLKELDDIVTDLEGKTPRGLVILSDKKNGFIAGADIKVISSAENSEQAAEFIRLGQSIFNRIEKLRFPTVCLIHGFCMGGGYELALACRYRIALDDPSTRLGLPEIKLGIHPGFGGAMRLPLLIGAPAAMDIMLTGRAVSARSAKKMGMIDFTVAERHLRKAAADVINTKPPRHKLKGWKKYTNHALARPLLARIFRNQVAKKAPKRHYPAPYALIDLWEKHGGSRDKMLKGEETSLSKLVVGKTAQNLIRVFFLQDKLKSLGDKKLFTPRRIHVIGAGVMGGDIAAWCALQGYQVTIQDRQEKNIARVYKSASKLFQKKLKNRLLVQAAMDRLVPDMDGLGVSHADVIIEAIFEDKDAKQSLYREIEPKLKDDALLATNTSSIPLEQLSEALNDPGRLVGIHFFNPVAMMQLVEIVRGDNTRQDVLDKAAAFTRHINRLPLPVKSSPGFLVNRVLMPYLVEAVILESEGIKAPVIDAAATGFGMPMGPIALADTVGLDICLSVAENLASTTNMEIPQRLKTLVHEGHLGKKTNRGFYHYKKGKPTDAKAGKSDHRPSDVQDRLMLRFVNEAVACLREGVVADKELLDAGMIFGTGFAPFRGGPLHYVDEQGTDTLSEKMIKLEQQHGPRFEPDAGFKPGKEPHLTVVRDYASNEL
ncbi:MAG: 3-hydroxyacyl-CoA dehydrogenase NAD-binding domain-containing protein [Gammaproteobacteria bacterium]|jgi:3-hydroxyacyl-CoA dehydrogenase/enoyl-CoA hydratase/3-hydroxybutyryl-CoA epimerase